MAMDRHDKEREMAAVLLSTLYVEVIEPSHIYLGFSKLVESSDDLYVDIPDAVDILALFIARAVVDDILPPAFLTKQLNSLLIEYVSSGDKVEACRCIKDLKVPFFHHDIIKRALILAMEKRAAEGRLLDLLRVAADEGLINSSQISKGFNRLIDTIDDLILDIPNARDMLQSLISKAASEGWLSVSSLLTVYSPPEKHVEENTTRLFKLRATAIIKEYFLTGDILEVMSSLISENLSSPMLNGVFIKKLITLAMDRRNREKEMASVLLTFLCFPPDDVVKGFFLLIESAEDTALDIPAVVEDLAMFLARAVVDEVIAPSHLFTPRLTIIHLRDFTIGWFLGSLSVCRNHGHYISE